MLNSSFRPSPPWLEVAFAIRIAASESLLMARAGCGLGSSNSACRWDRTPGPGLGADPLYAPLGPGSKHLPPWLEAANPFQNTSPGSLSMAGVDVCRG